MSTIFFIPKQKYFIIKSPTSLDSTQLQRTVFIEIQLIPWNNRSDTLSKARRFTRDIYDEITRTSKEPRRGIYKIQQELRRLLGHSNLQPAKV